MEQTGLSAPSQKYVVFLQFEHGSQFPTFCTPSFLLVLFYKQGIVTYLLHYTSQEREKSNSMPEGITDSDPWVREVSNRD